MNLLNEQIFKYITFILYSNNNEICVADINILGVILYVPNGITNESANKIVNYIKYTVNNFSAFTFADAGIVLSMIKSEETNKVELNQLTTIKTHVSDINSYKESFIKNEHDNKYYTKNTDEVDEVDEADKVDDVFIKNEHDNKYYINSDYYREKFNSKKNDEDNTNEWITIKSSKKNNETKSEAIIRNEYDDYHKYYNVDNEDIIDGVVDPYIIDEILEEYKSCTFVSDASLDTINKWCYNFPKSEYFIRLINKSIFYTRVIIYYNGLKEPHEIYNFICDKLNKREYYDFITTYSINAFNKVINEFPDCNKIKFTSKNSGRLNSFRFKYKHKCLPSKNKI